jgi:hypothetical protein
VEYESAVIYFDKARPPGFELETSDSNTMLATMHRLDISLIVQQSVCIVPQEAFSFNRFVLYFMFYAEPNS